MKRLLLLLLASALLFNGCSRTLSNAVHHSVKETQQQKERKIVFLPVDVSVEELTASGLTEEVPEWSEQGTVIVDSAVKNIIRSRKEITMVTMPAVNDEEQAVIDQHIALYDLVAGNALAYSNHPAWKDLRDKQGYTLGKGLAFIRERCDADAALMVIGRDYISSAGRKTTAILFAALGAYVPLGRAILHAGVIDLETGDILWMNTSFSEALSLKEEKEAREMVDMVFDKYMEFNK
jgi:hypothetical protein